MCCCGGEVADDRTGAASLRAPDLAMIQVALPSRPEPPPADETESGAREIEATGREGMEVQPWRMGSGVFLLLLRDGDARSGSVRIKKVS